LGGGAEATEAAAPRRRLTAEARKSSILTAARRAFTDTGDMNGTTIKLIAGRSGISEAVIYRHFEAFRSSPPTSPPARSWAWR